MKSDRSTADQAVSPAKAQMAADTSAGRSDRHPGQGPGGERHETAIRPSPRPRPSTSDTNAGDQTISQAKAQLASDHDAGDKPSARPKPR